MEEKLKKFYTWLCDQGSQIEHEDTEETVEIYLAEEAKPPPKHNLYSVTGGANKSIEVVKIIIAESRQAAIIKFMELVDPLYHININPKYICKEEDIFRA